MWRFPSRRIFPFFFPTPLINKPRITSSAAVADSVTTAEQSERRYRQVWKGRPSFVAVIGFLASFCPWDARSVTIALPTFSRRDRRTAHRWSVSIGPTAGVRGPPGASCKWGVWLRTPRSCQWQGTYFSIYMWIWRLNNKGITFLENGDCCAHQLGHFSFKGGQLSTGFLTYPRERLWFKDAIL